MTLSNINVNQIILRMIDSIENKKSGYINHFCLSLSRIKMRDCSYNEDMSCRSRMLISSPQYYGAAFCGYFARARPRAHLLNASCGLPRGFKISKILEPFRKAKISEIFDVGTTKHLGNFWSRGLCLQSSFLRDRVIYLSLAVCAAARRSA